MIVLDDRAQIFACLSHDIAANVYQIGDLDDAFFPRCTFYASGSVAEPAGVVLVYAGAEPCVLCFETSDAARATLDALLPTLRGEVHLHLASGLLPMVEPHAETLADYGRHHKLVLSAPERLPAASLQIEQLTDHDLPELLAFFAASYPGNWFDPRMIDTGCYVAVRDWGELAAVAGVHVVSAQYGVAALGNIATHPLYRRRGWGRVVTAACCQALLEQVTVISLNVHSDNHAAIALYTSLGFTPVTDFTHRIARFHG